MQQSTERDADVKFLRKIEKKEKRRENVILKLKYGLKYKKKKVEGSGDNATLPQPPFEK